MSTSTFSDLLRAGEDSAPEIADRLNRDPERGAAELRSALQGLDATAMGWLARLLARLPPGPAWHLFVDMWGQALQRLREAQPAIPPWQLSSWTWDQDPQLFFEDAGENLASVWTEESVEAGLPTLLRSSTPTTRAAAANLLGFWHDRRNMRFPSRVEAGLSAQLADPEAPVREEAAWALSLAPGGTSQADVVRLTSDADGRVRAGAFSALGALAGENIELRSVLVRGLRDPHPWARIAALQQLELGAPELANAEAARLSSDPDPWVREHAEEVSQRVKGR
jgi:hypothetical protein